MQSPLKAALTGLELVLARAQIWEESAAKHVSLASELEGVAALATRWRRLELAAWRNLLKTTRSRHAAGQPHALVFEKHACTPTAMRLLPHPLFPTQVVLPSCCCLSKPSYQSCGSCICTLLPSVALF